MNRVEKRSSTQPVMNCRMHPIDPVLISFGGGGKHWSFRIFLFPMGFHQVPISSQWVPKYVRQLLNVLPNMFLIAPHFVPYALLNNSLLELT